MQARERYYNIVSPEIGKSVWTPELHKLLLELAPQYDYCWKAISELPAFGKRTDNSLWREFKKVMMRYSKEEIRAYFNESGRRRKLDKVIIKYKEIFDRRVHTAEVQRR